MAVALTLVATMLLLSLAGCGQGLPVMLGGGETQVKSGPAAVSDDIFLALERFRSLNPAASKDEDVYFLNKLVYEGLFALDESLTTTPVLAETWSYSEDGSALALQLRKDVLWQDGQPFDGQDVAFSVDCYKNADGHLYAGNVENIESVVVDKKDPSVVTVYFKSNTAAGLERLTFPILPRHLYKTAFGLQRLTGDFVPVGTGPYAVTEFDANSHVALTGNSYYRGDVPENRLIFQIMSDSEDALNMLDINLISYAVTKSWDRDMIYRNPRVNAKSFPSNECVWLGFNFRNPFLRVKSTRQAIASAIDTTELRETCYYNSGMPCENLYFPGFLGINLAQDLFPADIERAKGLLAEVGFQDMNMDGFLDCYYTDGVNEGYWTNFNLKLLVNGDDPQRVDAAKLIQGWLARAGVNCESDVKEQAEYEAALSEGNFDLYLGTGRFNETYDLRMLLHSGYENPVAYANPTLDILLDKASGANLPEQRRQVFAEIRSIVNDEIPYYCLLYKTYGAVASPAFSGALRPMFTNLYRNCEDWRCVYDEERK
jgi:peptide/nickel transport system substrate-binding protein